MPDVKELRRLLSLVTWRRELSYTEGLDPFRDLLEGEDAGRVRDFLFRELPKLEGERRGGIAYVLADHFRQTGDLKRLTKLFASDDARVRRSVLNALWGEPGDDPAMGPGIVALALQGAADADPGVRTEACSVFQNQAAWKVDVSAAVEPLLALLQDPVPRVRHQAAYAVGNLARARHDMSRHVAPLRDNLRHDDTYVPEAAAWALWQLSRAKHDIGPAVSDLAARLASGDDYNEPRKQAAGALLHHAKKSAATATVVREAVAAARPDPRRKEVKKFLDQLGGLK